MDIKLQKLSLKNFKGIKELDVNFNCRNTNICGDNATGKTTIYDAFLWLLFNKDSSNKTDFNIKTLGNNGKVIHMLEHEVEAILLVNNQELKLKKMLQENWVKKRGQAEQEFSGNVTSYWIDDVPVQKKDYDLKINELVDEQLFKLITNPLFFNTQLNWQKRREILLNICGDLTDEDVLNSDGKWLKLKTILNGKSTNDYSKIAKEQLKKLKEEKEKIPVRIDELTSTLLDTADDIDYESIEKEKQYRLEEMEKINKTIEDINKTNDINTKFVNKLAVKRNELATLRNRLENAQKSEISNKKIDLSNKINEKNNTITQLVNKNETTVIFLEDNERMLLKLRDEWETLNASNFILDNSNSDLFICPTCKQNLPILQKNEKMQEMKNNFENEKKKGLESINVTGKELKSQNEKWQNENIDNYNKIEKLREDVLLLKNEISILEEQEKTLDSVSLLENSEYKELINEVATLEKHVSELVGSDASSYREQITKLQEDINSIDKTLANRDVTDRTKSRIDELKELEQKMANQVLELEEHTYLLEEFIKAKVNILEKNINSIFKFVKFKLFDMQINGGISETCEALVNGVPFADVNNASKINAGLDIINTLSTYYNKKATIFVDNSESVNNLIDVDTQIIRLVVSKDASLRIEVL